MWPQYEKMHVNKQKPNSTVERIRAKCRKIETMLVAKNLAYGDSATRPLRVFSRADGTEQIRVRIDDKLSRLMRGEQAGEDTVLDLIGYLILLLIARDLEVAEPNKVAE